MALLLVAWLSPACGSDYAFDNPFEDGGDPFQLSGSNEGGKVALTWTALTGVSFDEYVVFRAGSQDDVLNADDPVATVDKDESSWQDKPSGKDGTYVYYAVAARRGDTISQRSFPATVVLKVDTDGDGIGDSSDPYPNDWTCQRESDCPSGKRCALNFLGPDKTPVGVCEKDDASLNDMGAWCAIDSDCEGEACMLEQGKGYCSVPCVEDYDCTGSMRCVSTTWGPLCKKECGGDGDCSAASACGVSVNNAETAIVWSCWKPAGYGKPGSSCSKNEDCRSYLCDSYSYYCSAACEDCPGGMYCAEWTFTGDDGVLTLMACSK